MGTTAFPGGVDNFATTSPTNLGDDDSTGRTHSERHDDMEAAMEAVQAEVLSGMVLVTSGSFTTASTLNVDSCFTSAHDDYHVVISTTAATVNSAATTMRLRASSTDETGSVYVNTHYYYYANALVVSSSSSATSVYLGEIKSPLYSALTWIDVMGPALAGITGVRSLYQAQALGHVDVSLVDTSTQYDGITIAISSGTFTGTYRIYGLPK